MREDRRRRYDDGFRARRWNSSRPEPAGTRSPDGLPMPRQTAEKWIILYRSGGEEAIMGGKKATAADATTGRRRSPRRATTLENGLTKTEAMAETRDREHRGLATVCWTVSRGRVLVSVNSFGLRYPRADRFYGVDLEIRARGSMSLKVTDPVRFVRNFVPATTVSYSFDDEGPRRQILSEFVQSFIVAINSLSISYFAIARQGE